jgi:predicted HicB family RNase H-like nuclease
MTKRALSPDVPTEEVLTDSRGRVVDDAYVEAAVMDALSKARGRGRPSLSAAGESPLLRVRISQELDAAVSRAAERAGESRADWVRHVLDDAVRRTG